jgi:7-cyano-7-deazaguanine synthase in queuosine biosynthesis
LNLICFDKIRIGNLRVKDRAILATYELEVDGVRREYDLMEVYEGSIRDIEGIEEIAALISIVPAINYTLFTKEIDIEFPINELDLKFFMDMSEITARDIFVNRIVKRTGLIKDEFIPDPESLRPEDASPKAEVNAKIGSTVLDYSGDELKCGVMVSGGKDSLLSFMLLKEAGCEVHPFFFNESGRHWHVSLKAYRYFRAEEPRTSRVWSNVDRLFNFIESNMRILVKGFRKKTKEIYPIRLFWFEHWAFSFLPIMMRRGIGNIIFGNEYDDPSSVPSYFKGIKHYNAVYDQSQDFEDYMTNWFKERGLGIKQWSPIRSISGLIVQRILYRRYKDIMKLQMSCHTPRYASGELRPCGSCNKCIGIRIFLLANGIDPKMIGYGDELSDIVEHVETGKYRLDEDELEHSLYLMSERLGVKLPRARPHPEVETVRFNDVTARIDHIPYPELRRKVFNIIEEYVNGYSILRDGKWVRVGREELGL